jgi:excinuclease ABC subunit C
VVVDGGVGQVRAARAALDRAATRPVSLLGLAKREETVIREGAPPLRLSRRRPALHLLQRVRDEAHRFGLDYHRRLRTRARIASALDQIPGIGPGRRAALLKAFGSIEGIRAAAPEQVAAEARLPLALAERVRERLAGYQADPAPKQGRGPAREGAA